MRSTIHFFCALSNKNFASLPHVKNTKGWRTNSCCTHALHRFRFDKKESAQSNGIPLLDGSSIHRGREGLRLTEGYDAKNFPPRSVFLFFLCKSTPRDLHLPTPRFNAPTPTPSHGFSTRTTSTPKKTESIEKKPFQISVSNAPTSQRRSTCERFFWYGIFHKRYPSSFVFPCSVR